MFKFGGRLKMKKLLTLIAMLIVSMLAVSMVSAATSTLGGIDASDIDVYVNDEKVDESYALSVKKGEVLDIEVKLTNDGADAKNIQVEAELTNYEYDDYDNLEDETHTFDVDASTRDSVSLRVTVPNDFDGGNHNLKIRVSDSSKDIVKYYNLKVVAPRNLVDIKEVEFAPGSTILAGRGLRTNVVLENFGAKDEKDVKVTISMPELGISDVKYVDMLESGEKENVEEMFLAIPAGTVNGDYNVVATVVYDKYETVSKTYTINIQENALFQEPAKKLVVMVAPEVQSVNQGETVTYEIGLLNQAFEDGVYVLKAENVEGLSTSLSNNVVLLNQKGGKKVVQMTVTASEDAKVGNNKFGVLLMNNGEVVEELVFEANVVENGSSMSLRNGVEIALIVLVVLLVIVGLIIGFNRLRKDDEEENETYY
jgi:uncharacterized membrane protein